MFSSTRIYTCQRMPPSVFIYPYLYLSTYAPKCFHLPVFILVNVCPQVFSSTRIYTCQRMPPSVFIYPYLYLSTYAPKCSGEWKQVYGCLSSAGNMSTSWKMIQSKAINFSASWNPMFISEALLKMCGNAWVKPTRDTR